MITTRGWVLPEGWRTILTAVEKRRVVDGASLLVTAGVQSSTALLALARKCAKASNRAVLGRLHGESLAHDRASVGIDLQLGHGAAAGRGIGTSGRGHGTQSCRRRRLEEGAHGLGLTQDGIHGDETSTRLSV